MRCIELNSKSWIKITLQYDLVLLTNISAVSLHSPNCNEQRGNRGISLLLPFYINSNPCERDVWSISSQGACRRKDICVEKTFLFNGIAVAYDFKLLSNNISTICYTQLYPCIKGITGYNELIALTIDVYKKF